MNRIIPIFVLLFLLISSQQVIGQIIHSSTGIADTLSVSPTQQFHVKKRPYFAAAEVVLLNLGVNAFDRFVLQDDYAVINGSTIKQNFKTGFVWDNDSFSTNLLWHPYHGSLYFNAARSNGLNFWASTPYVLGGSLMWEFFMENEPASINDVFSTTIGGIALGEVAFRSSSLILDNSKRGTERVAREVVSAVLSPINAFNRLTRGEMWKGYPSNTYDNERLPFILNANLGWRHMAEDEEPNNSYNGMILELGMRYGDPFYNDSYKPFEYFTVDMMLNIGGDQPGIGSINALGILWGKTLSPAAGHDMTVGIFQHYDFYQSTPLKGTTTVPFELAQSAAIGGGAIYKFPPVNGKLNISCSLFASAILMGGTLTDYFTVNDRDYNMGSGYSLKLRSLFELRKTIAAYLNFEQYHLYTWKGYPNEPNPIPPDTDIKYLNAQGNKGNILFNLISFRIDVSLIPKLKMSLAPYFYFRHTHYDYFDDVDSKTFETRVMISYTI